MLYLFVHGEAAYLGVLCCYLLFIAQAISRDHDEPVQTQNPLSKSNLIVFAFLYLLIAQVMGAHSTSCLFVCLFVVCLFVRGVETSYNIGSAVAQW